MTTHETATRYPLAWPTGWKRTTYGQRKAANFSRRVTKNYTGTTQGSYTQKERLTVAQALDRLQSELRRLYAQRVVVSTNVPTRNDGLPYSNAREPEDPGVAVYFILQGAPRVLACDRWTRVADNIAAIAGHIDALRAQERYGVGTLEQAFAGYAALPPVGGTQGGDWRAEMDFQPGDSPITIDVVEARYRALLKQRHPDQGGSHDAVVRLNLARDAARAYFKTDRAKR